MSTVYVVHEPARWDHAAQAMVPIDISKAAEYGPLRIVLPGLNRPPAAAQALGALKAAFAGFGTDDYLLLAGDMDLLVWASSLALRRTGGKLNLLRWNNRGCAYRVCRAPDGLFD